MKAGVDITEDMYRLAKMIVEAYENNPVVPVNWMLEKQDPRVMKASEEMKKLVDTKGMYLNPFVDGVVMPCCGRRHLFSYGAMMYLPKNSILRYRPNGDVDFDPKSRRPEFVEYNNLREVIRQAKEDKFRHVHWRTSVACDETISKDGYRVHNDLLHTVSW